MMEYLKSQLIREIDLAAVRELGIPSLLLMENAARGACDVLEALNPSGRVVIVCGPGNNGGDGLAIARQLSAREKKCDVFLIHGGKTLSDDAQANREILNRCGIAVHEVESGSLGETLATLSTSDWIIDALLGTGMRGELRSPFAEVVRSINQSVASVLSIDVPSGLDAETGEPCGVAVRANATVTFVAKKSGFRQANAASYLGHIEIRHIGIPQRWLTEWCLKHDRLDS